MLYFLTGNKNKFEEVKAMLPGITQLDIDLPEIQGIDAREIMKAKVREATHHHKGKFIVEDTGLYLDCLHGLPGPLIKWFLKTMRADKLARVAERLGDTNAEAKTIIGYAVSHDEIHFFEGAIKGTVVAPRGESGFGWDPIFVPDGYTQTFAEMGRENKSKISMRRSAVIRLKEFLTAKAKKK